MQEGLRVVQKEEAEVQKNPVCCRRVWRNLQRYSNIKRGTREFSRVQESGTEVQMWYRRVHSGTKVFACS